jgi:hypothetical protein
MMGKSTSGASKPDAANRSFEKAYSSSGGNAGTLSLKGYVLAKSGRHSEAEQIVHGLIETGKDRSVPPTNIARVYLRLGNRECALRWLDIGYEARDVGMVFLTIDPKWDDLRSAQISAVRHPPQSGWLDELDRLEGGCSLVLGVALRRAYLYRMLRIGRCHPPPLGRGCIA